MKRNAIFSIIAFLGLSYSSLAQLVVESENATLSGGPSVATYKSTPCVYMQSGGSITHNFNITKKGFYKLELRVAAPQYKEQFLYINNTLFSKLKMNANAEFYTIDMGAIALNPGNNTIEIRAEWGYAYFDKVTLTVTPPVDYSKTAANLINPNSDDKTKEVYQYMRSQYGKNIISGQTAFWDSLQIVARKQAKVRAFDFQKYSQGYAYLWKNGGHTLGWEDDGSTQSAINWYNSTKGQGIVSFQWHWHAPMNSLPGRNTFMTNQTTFDVSRAVVPGNQEYTEIIEDIDSIATQLKKLQAAGVPVLWRPLHEAAGNGAADGSQAWFWWGAKGAAVCEKLWDIMYARLTNYHQLNNLIWVWSTPEDHWYLGNAKVDVFGYDSYPVPIHNNSQKAVFSQMYNICNGEKLIAMTENGPIPDPNKCIEEDAMWSYFSSWSDLLTKQNTKPFIASVYQHEQVIAIENANYWHFDNSKEGWNTAVNMTTVNNNGFLEATITANDPQVFSANNLMLSAQKLNWLIVAMQNNTSASSAEFFWTTQSSPNFDGTKRVSFPITPNDTKVRYYIVDLSSNPAWTGEIKQLRLDPTIAASGSVKIDFIKFTAPFSTLATIPGTIEAENFNIGGQGNAYFDSDLANNGNVYRTKESVDIQTSSEGGFNIGWTATGEWMEYLVNVTKTASYDFVLRTASATNGNQFHLQVDGENVSGVKTVNTLGGLQTYFDIKNTVRLTQGKHVLKLAVDKANGGFNLNKMVFTEATTTGLEDEESSNLISVYPNPANNVLNVKRRSTDTVENIQLINATGEMVFTKKMETEGITIDVQNLSSGVYVLKVGNAMHKVVLTK